MKCKRNETVVDGSFFGRVVPRGPIFAFRRFLSQSLVRLKTDISRHARCFESRFGIFIPTNLRSALADLVKRPADPAEATLQNVRHKYNTGRLSESNAQKSSNCCRIRLARISKRVVTDCHCSESASEGFATDRTGLLRGAFLEEGLNQ